MESGEKWRHIGIVACSAEGAALCYRTICQLGHQVLGEHQHPQVSMHGHNLKDYVDCLEAGDLQGVNALMMSSANKLKAAGADFLICPDNTIHQALSVSESESESELNLGQPLPWLHIADVVAKVANAKGYQRVGITGTQWLVNSEVYPKAFERRAIQWLRPSAEQVLEVSRIIMQELVAGQVRQNSTEYLLSVIQSFKAQGCDAVVLGCTELPLVIDDSNASIPVLDSTRLLAKAAFDLAIGGIALSPTLSRR